MASKISDCGFQSKPSMHTSCVNPKEEPTINSALHIHQACAHLRRVTKIPRASPEKSCLRNPTAGLEPGKLRGAQRQGHLYQEEIPFPSTRTNQSDYQRPPVFISEAAQVIVRHTEDLVNEAHAGQTRGISYLEAATIERTTPAYRRMRNMIEGYNKDRDTETSMSVQIEPPSAHETTIRQTRTAYEQMLKSIESYQESSAPT